VQKYIKVISLIVFFMFSVKTYATFDLPMSVIQRNITAYTSFLKEKNKNVLEITSLDSDFSNRNVACMVIIMQALNLGGFPVKLEMVSAPNAAREIAMTKAGHVAIMHQDIWVQPEFSDFFFISTAIIPNGSFVKGIYTLDSNKEMLKVSSIEDLKPFSATHSPNWQVGWDTLSRIGLKSLHSAPKKEFMFNQVLFWGVDFTIQEFTNLPGMAYEFSGDRRLIPVPGVKIALNGVRSFIVSKKHKLGKQIYTALQIGLIALRKKGTVKRFLTESGFYKKEVEDWKILRVEPGK